MERPASSTLPTTPGIYIYKDAQGRIIYVGKAISLKNRVRQYFQSSRGKTAKIQQMVSRIARFEYIVTDSELEALVLARRLAGDAFYHHGKGSAAPRSQPHQETPPALQYRPARRQAVCPVPHRQGRPLSAP